MSSAGASPSQLFGGVDQLIREGQDWIFRDQTQLASGFDNWSNQNFDDIANWFASTGTAPATGQPFGAGVRNPILNGGPVGGSVVNGSAPNGYNVNGVPISSPGSSANGGARVNNMGGVGGMQGFTYDERSWYDYQ